MKWASLRVRVGLAYTLFTLSCLSLFGLFLHVYLGHALEASRAPTMLHRAARLSAFVDSEHVQSPGRPLSQILDNFLKATPETDEIIVRSVNDRSLLFAGGGEPVLLQHGESLPRCSTPCFLEFVLGKSHFRALIQHAVLAGTPVELTLAGSIDEHYDILRTIGTSYLIFVPFLLIASLTGGYLLSGRALLPVGRITKRASELSISDLQGRVPVPKTGDELQNLAEAWNAMLARLQASVERTAQFTSDASHDLRTSVAVMLASVELALRKPRAADEYREILRTLQTECEHTLRLLEDLLASARDGYEQHALEHESLDLSRMVRERCALFRAEALRKQQTLQLEVEPDAWLDGDRSLLHRLIGVLVDNAIKYTPSGGTICISLSCRETQLLLKVQDNGPGIATANLSRIFGRAFRAPIPQNTQPGRGLGLNIARWIAEAHQAKLTVESESGQGSIFAVAFPIPATMHLATHKNMRKGAL